MKLKLSLLTFLMFLTSVAQQGINYKALIKDNLGNVIANQTIDVQFTILKGVAQTNVYQETHTPTTDDNGLIVLNIGNGTSSDVFSAIAWGTDDHYLNTQIDTGSGLVDMGTTQFMAVPYALNAANAANRINDLNDAKSDVDGTEDGSSIFLGVNAGVNDSETDNQNIGIGYQSLFSNTVGNRNIGIGNFALENNIGISGSNVSGDANVAVGNQSLRTNIQGYFNTAIGTESMESNDDGSRNVALGYGSMISNVSGINNTALGFGALSSNLTSSHNVAVGFDALLFNKAENNVGIGAYAAFFNNANSGITAVGYEAMRYANDSETEIMVNNTAIGYQALRGSTTPTINIGVNNTALGYQAIKNNESGNENVGIGSYALENNIGITGSNVSGDANVAIGNQAMRTNTQGYFNTAIGTKSMLSNDDGSRNVAVGYASMGSNISGINNTASGFAALASNIDGQHNTGYGSNAIQFNEGDYNVGIGSFTLWNNISGNSNVALGYRAGYNELGSNKLYIHNNSVDENNALIYGEFDTGILRTNSEFQIGNPALTGFAFPLIDGASNQILQTDGNGVLTWVDNSTSVASGLEALDEGNGIGWRITNRDPANYGNIGMDAVDLSISNDISTSDGATGIRSVALGYSSQASGQSSTALGFNTEASGENATAMGLETEASGDNSTALGNGTIAIGLNSTAMGKQAIATGSHSLAVGNLAQATNNVAIAMGFQTVASGQFSTALGGQTTASNYSSFAAGNLTQATGDISTAMGIGSVASGDRSTAFGHYSKAESYMSTAIGAMNLGGGSPDSWIATDPLFEIGNSTTTPSNALTVLKNGTIIAPSFDISEITDNKALITKEFADANYLGGGSGTNPTGLEAINEGNGVGWGLIGRNPNNYGNIGLNSIDISYSDINSSDFGATGNNSFAGGRRAIASGNTSTAFGMVNNASGDYSTAMGRETTASNIVSTAMGYQTTASGENSTAMGDSTIASNNAAIAMGVATVASGVFSTALGEATTASSRSTIAMGRGTIADDIHSAVVGQFNDNTSSTTTLFQVGNGGSTSNRSNAFNIDSDGTITAPSFDILEITDPKALITKEYLEANSSPATGLEAINEGNGIGWRLAGRNPNNYGNIGNNAIDLSFNGLSSATHGASGSHSIALGIQTKASDFYSTAMGVNSNASGERSTAIGNGTLASGYASLAMGTATTASGISSATAMGNNTLASAEYSTAMGYYTIASNSKSSALGNHSIADDNSSTVLGKYNDNTFSTTTLFQVGNGLNDSSRSNSLTVMENGYTSLGTHNEEPTADLQVNHGNGTLNGFKLQNQGTNNNWWRFYTLNSNGFLYLYSKAGGNTNNVGSFNDVSGAYAALSDRRVKDNFNELYFNWDSFMQLKPLTYYYKADESKQSQIGFIAQDVESIYPELVNYNTEDDLYQLNYSGFGVIAIKAIQELRNEVKSLSEENIKLKALLANQHQDSTDQSLALQALLDRVEALEKDKIESNRKLVKK